VSEDVVIRLAEPREYAAAGSVCVSAYVDDGLIGPDHGYVDRLLDAADRAVEAELWVADLDGEIVGTVTFCPPGSTYRETASDGEGEFRMLAVAKHARGRSVGRLLVERCVERCREFGCEQIVLCTMPEMESAQRLYTALGFARDDTLDWSPVPGVQLIGFRADVPPATVLA
jgi:ribosomal protein S18 acetylase RimI-like enzyme